MATNKETPGAATPGETINLNGEPLYTADDIDSLLSEISRDIPGLRIRVSRQLKASDGKGNLMQGFINKPCKRLNGLFRIGVSAVALFAKSLDRAKQTTSMRRSNLR